MKSLYVSDLDGTLFNKKKRISDRSADIINRCIEKGMLFSVATARMPYGCDYRLKDLHMNVPGIVTNGVFLYDFQSEEIISAEAVPVSAAQKVIRAFKDCGMSCFLYTYDSRGISIYYDGKRMEEQTQYYSDRALQKCAEVTFTKKAEEMVQKGDPVYLTCTGTEEELKPVCRKLDEIEGIKYSFYLNIYNGMYWLEVFSAHASKKNALKKLMKTTGSEELVVFGDNFNDLSMIEIADRSYAPMNALPEIKKVVDRVLPDCDHDGVAAFLAEEWGLNV